ncbi:LytTR family DNA-binding domain-containing protein [Rhodocytophaga aerolata]|uniref:LytTR family DNA-binding domain-containing protein n=1 Tax=Rhodocytophaga aerolata TaxID=455078 RepID=A0ABT8QY38_9BACT|nr:LytTR family DNA-binding domain-containing protein [Rhodocytophaga aerolata]MDO1444751.1 LytTR family DNA-binding domain-containing protein [Rhodocytophaga aerolata]
MRQTHYPDIWLRIIAIPLTALFVRDFALYKPISELVASSNFYLELSWSVLMVLVLWETNRAIIQLLDRRYSWVKQAGLRLVMQLSLVTGVSVILLLAITYVHHILSYGYSENFHLTSLHTLNVPILAGFVVLLNLVYTGMYLAKYHRALVHSLKMQLEETIRVAEKLKLDKLYNEHSELSATYYQKHLIVNFENTSVPVLAEDVAYIFFLEGQSHVILFDGTAFHSRSSLENLELFLDPALFFRINQQILANIQAIKQCRQDLNGKLRVELSPAFQHDVFVNKRKAHEFKEWLGKKI